jgi:tetratricopeptide (TPR) repeat protein
MTSLRATPPARPLRSSADRAARAEAIGNRCVADLLRHLDHPQRLRENALARRYFLAHHLDAAAAAAKIRAAVMVAIAGLPPRQRAIVERCDLQHELHATVLDTLAVSERYFYKERERALQAIARDLLRDAQPETAPAVHVDPLAAALAHASNLAQAGCVDRACRTLVDVAEGATDVEAKLRGICRLVEVQAYAGRTSGALETVQWGRALLADADDPQPLLAAHVDAAHALALRFHGQERVSETLARRARRALLVALRSGTRRAEVAESAVTAWAVMAERALEAGDVGGAGALTRELRQIVEISATAGPLTRLRADFHNLLIRSYADLGAETVAELEQLLLEALSLGLTAEAGMIAPSVAGCYRLLGRSGEALRCLTPLLGLFRGVCSGEALGSLLVQLANACIETGSAAQALPLLDEARRAVPAGSLVFAVSYVYMAHAQLVLRDSTNALQSAHRAIEQFAALDRPRFVGIALRYQALALEALGQPVDARSRIVESLDLLRAYARPPLVAQARRDALRLHALS